LLVPYDRDAFRRELALYIIWCNRHRPHEVLDGATPDEIYGDTQPACRAPRFEPHTRRPRGSPCAHPIAHIRGHCSERLEPALRACVMRSQRVVAYVLLMIGCSSSLFPCSRQAFTFAGRVQSGSADVTKSEMFNQTDGANEVHQNGCSRGRW
jgi:hypothetical protein